MNNDELILEIKSIDIIALENNAHLTIDAIGEDELLKLKQYVLDNLNSLDGGPSINNLEILNFKYYKELKKGTFRLKFQIDRRYCCSDTESCANDYLDFEFNLNDDTLIAKTEYFDWSLNN